MNEDEKMMRIALEQAMKAMNRGEVPVGAVLTIEGRILAKAHNSPISLVDPTAHAEVLVLREAARILGNYRLPGTTLYVTLEPCVMCAGAIIHARVARVVYGAADPKGGAVKSMYSLFSDKRLNHVVEVTEGVLGDACGEILSGFFRKKR
ncbi:MAG: tRNA adenosine(34) deaminase TadA [Syntrophales bacterium]|nr:tRNA adenosine(34) deaminase TadA [Syntrophales bacterium]